eukprot:366322-Chlamydomonas_euryale.AAC.9
MDSALQLMGMRGIVRKALCLLRGMNISQTGTSVTFEVFSVLGWFKSVEKYSLAGEPSLHRRRDMRSGEHALCVLYPCVLHIVRVGEAFISIDIEHRSTSIDMSAR